MREFVIYWIALAPGRRRSCSPSCWLLRSRYGLALTAIRDNELGARSNGVDVARIKYAVYVAVAFGTAMVGALIFLQKIRISPDTAFSVNDWTAFVIFITVIGGIGRIEGPIIGTVIFFLLRQTLADLGAIYLLILGVVAIAVMLKAPKGLWGLDRRPLRLAGVPAAAAAGDRQALSRGICARAGERIFCAADQQEFAHDPDPLHGPAGAAPSRRARRAFARSFQLRGAGRGAGREVLWPVRAQHRRKRTASSRSTPTAIRTAGASVSEGPRKKFTYVSFGAFEDDLPRFRERLEKLRIDRLDPPKGFESNGLWFRDPDGTLIEIRVAEKSSPNEKATFEMKGGDVGRQNAPNRSKAHKVQPRRLAHVLVFVTDISADDQLLPRRAGPAAVGPLRRS